MVVPAMLIIPSFSLYPLIAQDHLGLCTTFQFFSALLILFVNFLGLSFNRIQYHLLQVQRSTESLRREMGVKQLPGGETLRRQLYIVSSGTK